MRIRAAVTTLAITTLLALQFTESQSQGVTCFSEISCSGSSSSSSDFEACCLSTGYSYESGGSCKNCTVIGWKIASKPDGSINTAISFELEESDNVYEFVVSCLKGYTGRAPFIVEPQNTNDFTIINKKFTMARCKEQIVGLSLEVDERAMEPNEELTLSLVPNGAIDAIIVNEIDITIIDSDVVNLGFNEVDRVIKEGGGLLNIKVVQKNQIMTFDSNVTVQLIPVDYKYATDNDIVSPSRYSYDPDTPNRATGGLDYNSSPIILTFLGDLREVEVDGDVIIIDDSVDEVRQFFFVLLKVLNATNTDRINLTSTYIECNIDDNDDTYLSFELSYYVFPEVLVGTGDYRINIIKDRQSSTTETENKYEFTVQVKSLDKATKAVDFTASSDSQTINANEVRTAYGVKIIDDIIPEGNESFILSISSVPNKPQWLNGRSVTTKVTIIDNDELPVFGFVETNVTVAEDVGTYLQIVTLYVPESINLFGTFDFDVFSVEDSASQGSDYKKIEDFLSNIKYPTINRTVTVSVRDDLQLEDDEIFYLTLKHLPGNEGDSILNPSVATFTIVDNDRARVGFEMTNYTVDEDNGVVIICASVFEPNIDCPIQFSFDISFNTSDETAVSPEDYSEKSVVLHFDRCAVKSCTNVSIENNDIPEGTENFNVRIGRTPNLSSRIDLRPDQARVFIIDNDPIIVGYNKTVYTTTEGQGSVVLVAVVMSPETGAPRPFTIAASTSNGTAVGGSDYTTVMMEQLVFNTGDTTQSHTITILNDTKCERTPNEQFFSSLTYISGEMPISITPMRAEVVIDDFDEKECELIIGFLDTTYSVSEGDGFVLVKAGILSGSVANENVTVLFFTQPNSATDGADYTGSVKNLTFIVGKGVGTTMNLQIPILDDNAAESREFFSAGLILVDPIANVLVDPSQAVISIDDDDNLVVGFVDREYSVSEGDGSITVFVEIKQGIVGSGETVTLEFTTRDNTATSSSDYNSTTQILSFMSGQTIGTQIPITISITNDGIAENIESFFGSLSLQPTALNVSVSPDQAEVFITDNDEMTVGFLKTVYSVSEGDGTVTLTVGILSGTVGTGESVTLQFSTTAGSAVDPSDYITTTQIISFTSGETVGSTVNISIPVIDDNIAETLESFIGGLHLISSNLVVTVTPNRTQIFINDDGDRLVVGFTETTYGVSEDDGVAIVTVEISEGTIGDGGSFKLQFSTQDDTAKNLSDYTTTKDTITFTSGQSVGYAVNVSIPITSDTMAESIESFFTSITLLPTNLNVLVQPSSAEVFIQDDDKLLVGFQKTAYFVSERDGTVTVTVEIKQGTVGDGQTVSLEFTTRDNTAVNPVDYTATSKTITFTSGQDVGSTVDITIPIIDDNITETLESFFGSLTLLPTNLDVSVAPNQANISIIDNNQLIVGFVDTIYSVSEADGTITVLVEIKAGTVGDRENVRLEFTTRDKTASSPSDYKTTLQSISFTSGQSMGTQLPVSILVVEDNIAEEEESFLGNLRLLSTGLSVTVMPQEAEIFIVDNDKLVIGFQKTDYSVSEDDGTATVIVEIKQGTVGNGQTVSLEFTTGDNTAINPLDYNSTTQTISFIFGQGVGSTMPIAIPISDDTFAENIESFFGSLSLLPTNLNVEVTPNRTNIFINDNDQLVVGFVETSYSVSERDGSVTVAVEIKRGTVGDGETVSVKFATKDKTATVPSDYTSKSQTISFTSGQSVGSQASISIPIVDNNIAEGVESFLGNLSLIATTLSVSVSPDEAEIFIQDDDKLRILVNDTLTGDPLMTVPILTSKQPLQDSIRTSLCYEIHGEADKIFNLISDKYTVVNAHYAKVNVSSSISGTKAPTPNAPDLNVVDAIGVRARVNHTCYNIRVDLSDCQATVDGVSITDMYQLDGITVRELNNRVRIVVPNGDTSRSSLVMWIFCMYGTTEDQVTSEALYFRMMRFVVVRGLNLAPTSHGLIGQFWNIPVNVTEFDGNFDGEKRTDDYLIKVSHPTLLNERSFVGIKGGMTWEFENRPCLYVGNSQGGPIDEVVGPNDSVIDGEYTDYEVNDMFATTYQYTKFEEGKC